MCLLWSFSNTARADSANRPFEGSLALSHVSAAVRLDDASCACTFQKTAVAPYRLERGDAHDPLVTELSLHRFAEQVRPVHELLVPQQMTFGE